MKSMRALWAIAVAVLIAGCAAGGGVRPDWVNGNDSKYPSEKYLIGRGEADSESAAMDRARADLAKIFQVQVDVVSQDVLTYHGETSAGTSSGSVASHVTRDITTKTDQIINGIQMAGIWHDPATQTYYALAVLPRFQAANSLREEIDSLDTATQRYIQQARDSDDLLLKIAAADRALDAQVKRSAYQKSLKVVDRSGLGVEPRWNVASLRVDLDKLLHGMRIAARADNDPLGGLRDDVAGGLSAAGFLVDTGKDPAYVLKASLDMTNPELIEGWYWIRGTLYVQLQNPVTGQVRGTHQWDIKVSSRQASVVRQRAHSQIRDILKGNLRQVLIGFAVGEGRSS